MGFGTLILSIGVVAATWWWLHVYGAELWVNAAEQERRKARKGQLLRTIASYCDLKGQITERLIKDINIADFTLLKMHLLGQMADLLTKELSLPDKPTDAQLTELEARFTPNFPERAYQTFYDAAVKLFASMPPYLDGHPVFEVPLASALATAKPIDDFFHAFKREDKLFWGVYSTYVQNWYAADEAAKAKFYERNSAAFISRLCANTGFDFDIRVPVALPPTLRFEGCWIVAPHGTGKTTLLSAMLEADLEQVKRGEACVIILDGKGDLAFPTSKLAQFGKGGDLEGKLTLIEPHDNLSINFLDLGASRRETITLLEDVFSTFDAAPSSNMQTMLRMVLLLCTYIPNATLSDFRRIISEGWEPYRQYVEQLDHDEQSFFTKEFGTTSYKETKGALLARLRRLSTESDTLKGMFKAPYTRLKMAELMDTPGVCVIDLSWKKLTYEGAEFYGRFLIALILAAATQRSGRTHKLPVYVYMDEAQSIISNEPKIAQIIQTCRSQNIALIMAHQSLSQIDNEKVRSALGDCAIRIANSDEDAKALSDRMRTTAEQLQSLHKGEFAVFMKGMRRPLIGSVAPHPVWEWPSMLDTEFAALQAEMKSRYCYFAETENVYPMAAEEGPDYDTNPVK